MAIAYFGISLFGALSVACLARPLTQAFGFRIALVAIGSIVLLAVPLVLKVFPRVEPLQPAAPAPSSSDAPLNRTFWLLLAGSTIAVGGVAGVTQPLKLIFREAGYRDQLQLDQVYGWTVLIMLAFMALARFAFAWASDRFPKRHVISAAFTCMAAAMPMLFFLTPAGGPYLFAATFGFGMSVDFVVVPLLVADYFGPRSLPRVMGLIVPVNTVGQTWWPYLVSLVWTASGDRTIPLLFTFACILGGRLALALLPHHPPVGQTLESSGSPIHSAVQPAPEVTS
ncbi:MAG: hypothetical protein QM757_35990 [Paludibaculum sp.]